MAVYDNADFEEIYQLASDELRGLSAGVGVVCAEGQPILRKTGLAPRTVQDYFRGVTVGREQLAYPDRQMGTLVDGLKGEPAVWMVGTAFAIDRFKMLTAWHVVQDVLNEVDEADDASKLRVVLGYSRGSSSRSKPDYSVHRVSGATRVVSEGQAIDMAVLSLKDAVPGGAVLPILKNVNRPRNGDPVSLIGHPLGQPLKVSHGKIHDADPFADRSAVHVRGSACCGNSGCPVVWNGEVLGVFYGGTWPSEFATTRNGQWSHFYWNDRSNGGDGYDAGVYYVGELDLGV